MKVTFVVQRYGEDVVGGAERYVRELATGLVRDGHSISVVTSNAVNADDWAPVHEAGHFRDEGVDVYRLAVRAPRPNETFHPLHQRAANATRTPLWPWAQETWARAMGPDLPDAPALLSGLASTADVTVVVGYHFRHALLVTAAAAAHGPTVLVPTAHPEGAFHVGIVRRMFDHADRVICLSPEESDLVARVHGCGGRIDVVPPSVATADRPGDADIGVATAAHHVDGPYAAVVGRAGAPKGTDEAVRYFTDFHRAVHGQARLVLIGPGSEAYAGANGVIAVGEVDEQTKRALVAGCDVAVVPSYMESFSLALAEAWLMERPAVVQSRSTVLAGHARRSGGGVDYNGYQRFEAALEALFREPGLRSELGRNGREYVEQEFAWERVAPRFLASLERAIGSRGSVA